MGPALLRECSKTRLEVLCRSGVIIASGGRFVLERREDANDKSAHPQTAEMAGGAQQSASNAGVPAKTRGVHARLYNHPQKAQLRSAEGRPRPPDQRLRSDKLYSG